LIKKKYFVFITIPERFVHQVNAWWLVCIKQTPIVFFGVSKVFFFFIDLNVIAEMFGAG